MQDLTDRQKKVLKLIQLEKEKVGIEPSASTIARRLKMNVNGAVGHLKALERKGFLKKPPNGRAGYMQLITEDSDSLQEFEIPMLGQIAAGFAKEVYDNPKEILDLRRDSFGKDVLALKVSGDSMSEDGIFDEDAVIITTQVRDMNEKSILAVCVRGNEVTLKRIRKVRLDHRDYIDLVPSNKNFKTVRYPVKEVEIVGKMTGLVRKFKN